MNSEELEQSLRTEFDRYLENILEEVADEVSQFQQKLDAEVEKHKEHLNEAVQEFSARIKSERKFEAGFTESVVEHLRLARDEGARITATAIAEAEELTKAEKAEEHPSAPAIDLSDIRDAVNDISSQSSQSSILKSLISHASKFTSRGAFFVVKNNHFVGWRIFGSEEQPDSDSITDIVFPVDSPTVLGESVRSLSAVKTSFGTYDADADYLRQLGFSEPSEMYAIPLIARGRGVAAIYADGGESGDVNLEALETLVSVAGLTVELLAAAQSTGVSREQTAAAPQTEDSYEEAESGSFASAENESDSRVETAADSAESTYDSIEETSGYQFSDSSDVEEVSTEDVAEYDESSFEVAETDDAADEEAHFESEIQEVEVEDSASFGNDTDFETTGSESAETVEEPAEAGSSYSFSEESLAEETEESTEVKRSYFDDSPSGESLPADYAAFDDDLIEEVQTHADDSAVSEVSEYEEPGDDSAEEEVSYDVSTPVDDSVSVEQNDSYSFSSGSESFETNQDLNSTPVAFEDSEDNEEEPVDSVIETVEVEELSFDDARSAEEEPVAEPVEEPKPEPAPSFRTRFSDRNLDLPIEVSEDERRLHNDARRFARLLVSEIKLYNEQKVKEGRDSNDLYDRLREALDRSREMYDKRVQPAVVERFDYFHYEVVNTLAEGEESRLGSGYPGATVGS